MHRRPVYIYLFNVPSFSSRHFNKIKRTSRLGRLLALSLEILCMVWQAENFLIKRLNLCLRGEATIQIGVLVLKINKALLQRQMYY